MSGLPFILTPTGRARLINPENTGTSGLTISHVGVSASDAGVVGGVLQGEIKRLDTFAGQVVADDTIHVTIRDDSADVYSLRAFALYFEDGTLMGWHAQPAVILEKSAQAMLLMSGDFQFQNLDVTTLTFGDSSWTNPVATTTVFGVLRLATNEAAIAGTSVVDAVTPAGLLAALNTRLGSGAPSDFVKGLLNLATAALFRAAIGLGSASLRNEGANNGLDADLLDGQHGSYYRDWGNLTGKPGTFPPSAHGHAWADLSGVPSTATRWPSFAEVTDKPATYSPSAHIHAAADVTAGVFDVARIPDIAQSKVAGLPAALDALAPKASPQFSGNVGIGGSPAFPLDVYVGSNRVRVREASGVATIDTVNNAGSAFTALNFDSSALTRQGSTIWDASNFTPSSKANLLGGNAGWTGDQTLTGAAQFWRSNTSGGIQSIYGASDTFGGAAFGTGTIHPVLFYSSGIERGRLRADGVLEWTGADIQIRRGLAGLNLMSSNLANGYRLFSNVGDAADFGFSIQRWNGSAFATIITATTSGELQATGGFRNTSSRRVKDITGPNPYGLREVLQLETVVGSYKKEFCGADGARRVFLVAENVAEHIDGPARPMEGIEFEGETVLGLDYQQLVPVLVRAIQELTAEVRALKAGE